MGVVRLVVGFVEVFGAHVCDAKCGGYTSNKDEERLSESCHINNAKYIKYPADSRGRTIKAQRHLRHRPPHPSLEGIRGGPFPHNVVKKGMPANRLNHIDMLARTMGTHCVLTTGILTSSTSRLPAGRQVKLTWQAPTARRPPPRFPHERAANSLLLSHSTVSSPETLFFSPRLAFQHRQSSS